MLSNHTFRGLKRKGIALNPELLKIPSGFWLVNPTFPASEGDDVLVLGSTSRFYLKGKVATIWKSLPGSNGTSLAVSSMENSAETVSAILVLQRLGLVGID